MNLEGSVIETGVDKLVRIVKERGKVALADAAKELGVSLNQLSSFSEEGNGYPVYSGSYDAMSVKSVSARPEAAPMAPELTPGQEKITATVTLTYSIR